ncbi:MAG: LytR/AlgR family response regulator transcription factor, partial [bacterium]
MIRAIIVDDEELARDVIKKFLVDYPAIKVVAECDNGRDAVLLIEREKPDLIFLDIQMPELNGFEVLEHLDHIPAVVFSTAYDEYAIRAFEVNAVDYLLKPYSPD